MIEQIVLPPDLSTVIGSEKQEFAVKADRDNPSKNSFSLISLGAVFVFISSIATFFIMNPILHGKDLNIKINGVDTVVNAGNLNPIIVPMIIVGLFFVIGVSVLIYGIYSLLKKGGYFVGTSARLIKYREGKIKSIDWGQFTGNIEVSGKTEKGNIALEMKTGRIVSRRAGSSRMGRGHNIEKYVPDVTYMGGVPNPFEIEQICRKNIKAMNPTPATTDQAVKSSQTI